MDCAEVHGEVDAGKESAAMSDDNKRLLFTRSPTAGAFISTGRTSVRLRTLIGRSADDHGIDISRCYGYEIRILEHGDFLRSHGAFSTRALAFQWAELERQYIERLNVRSDLRTKEH